MAKMPARQRPRRRAFTFPSSRTITGTMAEALRPRSKPRAARFPFRWSMLRQRARCREGSSSRMRKTWISPAATGAGMEVEKK